jgi:hypothetical protein
MKKDPNKSLEQSNTTQLTQKVLINFQDLSSEEEEQIKEIIEKSIISIIAYLPVGCTIV